ncbi:putative uncharacterized protein [Prevotella sp. CAG:5226]|jgi:hypothetical protein|nr:putative uncharacterized protein [Prevotella sp. CAG:5226]
METITVQIFKDDVYEEVAKATDYTGAKLIDGDEGARDRILATDSDLSDLGRFWEESVLATNERLKEMLVSGTTKQILVTTTSIPPILQPKDVEAQSSVVPPIVTRTGYEAVLEVSKSFDKGLKDNVQSALRNFFIASIIAQWFKLANKNEAADYFNQAGEMMDGAERLLYSRKRPPRPSD